MILKKCILYHNDCYKQGTHMTGDKPTGIIVHSTGANNPNLKRYMQPVKGDPDYDAIIADIGINQYGNHWNQSGVEKCVHAFIGKNSAGQIETYQTLPWHYCPWGSGGGTKGSYNRNPTARVQFEVHEDAKTDKAYFDAVWKEAAEFCAYICKMYGLTTAQICSHKEAHDQGMATNHGDPDYWMKAFGKDMNWFRGEVQKLLDGNTVEPVQPEKTSATTAVTNTPGDTLNVRDGGVYTAVKIGALEHNSRVQVLESAPNGWKKVRLEGWVNGDYLK